MKNSLPASVSGIGTLTICALVAFIGAAAALAQDATPKDLRAFYRDNCVRCHGADGSARNADGKGLRGENFTDPDWQKESDDAKMAKVIQKGKFFGKAMPAFAGKLTQEESLRLVKEVLRKSEQGKTI
jgi:mono/diheme cytochrome c family protein